MNVFVDHTFKRGFSLDEERLRRINEILVRHGRIFDPDLYPSYEVFRADSLKYTAKDIEDVINEKNIEYQKIIQLHITMKKEDVIDLELLFDDEGGTNLLIEGNDKDRVFILFSDLREYIQHEVCTLRSPRRMSVSFILLISMIGMLFLFTYLVIKGAGNQLAMNTNIEDAIASQDIIEKLNYVISTNSINSLRISNNPALITLPITLLVMILFLFFDGPILRFIRKFFPSHMFLFGKEIERNARRRQLLNNIFWVVIIGAIISLVTGFVLNYFK